MYNIRKSGNIVDYLNARGQFSWIVDFFTGSWRRNFVDWLVGGGVRGVERKRSLALHPAPSTGIITLI